jgi:hypothetical protein
VQRPLIPALGRFQGKMANTLAGNPEPFFGFGNATTTIAPNSGTLSKLVKAVNRLSMNINEKVPERRFKPFGETWGKFNYGRQTESAGESGLGSSVPI